MIRNHFFYCFFIHAKRFFFLSVQFSTKIKTPQILYVSVHGYVGSIRNGYVRIRYVSNVSVEWPLGYVVSELLSSRDREIYWKLIESDALALLDIHHRAWVSGSISRQRNSHLQCVSWQVKSHLESSSSCRPVPLPWTGGQANGHPAADSIRLLWKGRRGGARGPRAKMLRPRKLVHMHAKIVIRDNMRTLRQQFSPCCTHVV